MTTQELLSIIGALIMILLTILAFLGKGVMSKMDKIANSLSKMEKDLSVLANDHTNLKDEVKEMKVRISKLEKE